MSKITLDSIYNAFLELNKIVIGIKDDIVGIKDEIVVIKEKQDKILVRVINLEEESKENAAFRERTDKDISYIKSMLEKDAKKQEIHEMEHSANVVAHDRFETRITSLEKAK